MRMTLLKCWTSLLCALLVAGCAGTDFVKPQPDSLKLGATTEAQIRAQFGSPFSEGSKLRNGEMVKTLAYAYANVGGEPLVSGVTPARGINFYFFGGTLVGYEFMSSFKADNTYYDHSKVTNLRKGTTSRAEVVSLLGEPHGAYMFPMIKEKPGQGSVYAYTETKGFTPYAKILVVSFDGRGLLNDVEFTEQGTRGK